ncbi:MAG: rRNA maturation RNase YbeY [Steroidobacteraceae bacterium]
MRRRVRPGPPLAVETQYAARRPWVPAPARLARWARAADAAAGGGSGGVCVRIVGAAAGRRLNRAYRGKDRPTNVLSFPASAEERAHGGALGDLVICAPVVAREARAQRKAPDAHWAHLVVHGVLHLHGLDHERPRAARAMEALEVEILRGLGYQDPYRPVTESRHDR